jgi:hypothetical protein
MPEPHFEWVDPRGPEFIGDPAELDENGDLRKMTNYEDIHVGTVMMSDETKAVAVVMGESDKHWHCRTIRAGVNSDKLGDFDIWKRPGRPYRWTVLQDDYRDGPGTKGENR